MSQPIFVKIQGATQGDITSNTSDEKSVGSLKVDDHVNEIIAQAINIQAERPVDPQSGQPTGTPQLLPCTLVKYLDRSSPLLLTSLMKGEQLKITASYYRTKRAGGDELYYTVEFDGATLVGINSFVPNALLPESKPMRDMEEIRFTCASITATHQVSNTQASYTWGKGNS